MSTNPDFVWVKTYNHANWISSWLFDTVRGAPNKLYSNSTNAEELLPHNGQLIVI